MVTVSGGAKLALAKKVLLEVSKKKRQLNILAMEIDAKCAQIESIMARLKISRLNAKTVEALRYKSISYSCCDADVIRLIGVISRLAPKELDTLVPRSPAMAELRRIIDSKSHTALKSKVRKLCTRSIDWKFKIQPVKQKAEIKEPRKAAN